MYVVSLDKEHNNPSWGDTKPPIMTLQYVRLKYK